MWTVIRNSLLAWIVFGAFVLNPPTRAQDGLPPLGTTLETQRQNLEVAMARLKVVAETLETTGNDLFSSSEIPLVRLVDPVLKALHAEGSGASSSLAADSRDLRLRLAEMKGKTAKMMKRWETGTRANAGLFARLPRLFERWNTLAPRLGDSSSRCRAETKEEFLTMLGQIGGVLRGLEDYPGLALRNLHQQRDFWIDLKNRADSLAGMGPSLGGEAPSRLQTLEMGLGEWLLGQNRRAQSLETEAGRFLQETGLARESLETARKRLQQYRP